MKNNLISQLQEQATYDLPYGTQLLLLDVAEYIKDNARIGYCKNCRHADKFYSGKLNAVTTFCNYHYRETKQNCFCSEFKPR